MSKFGYRVYRQMVPQTDYDNGRKYEKLVFDFVDMEYDTLLFQLSWMRSVNTNEWSGWGYSPTMYSEYGSFGIGAMAKFGKVLNRLNNYLSKNSGTPVDILEMLEKSRDFTQVVYENRLNKYLPLAWYQGDDRIAPEDFVWYENVGLVGGVLAPNEKTAKQLLTDKLLNHYGQSGYDKWVLAGKEVTLGNHQPVFNGNLTPAREMVKLNA